MTERPHAYFLPAPRLPFVLPTPPAGKRLISLAINESAYGASPKAVAAAQARVEAPNRYPDPASNELRAAISAASGLESSRIVCGNGSEELLDVIGRMFSRPGDQIMMSQSGFFQFAVVAARLGVALARAPERNLVTDVKGLLEGITRHTKVLFLAVPNNPTGTLLPIEDIRRLHAGLPEETVLVLDCAYGEFLPAGDLSAIYALARYAENIIVTRSFSKAYGLAAFRVGWAYAPEWMMPGLNMMRGVGNINGPAQAAAVAALADQAFVDHVVAETGKERAFLAVGLRRLGLEPIEGYGNFLLTRFPAEKGRTAEDVIARAMAEEGIWLRPVGEPGFSGWIRLGLGTRAENEQLLGLIGRVIG